MSGGGGVGHCEASRARLHGWQHIKGPIVARPEMACIARSSFPKPPLPLKAAAGWFTLRVSPNRGKAFLKWRARPVAQKSGSWRGVRAAEGARLESVYTATYRGFESRPLRQIKVKRGLFGLFLL